MLLYMWVGKCVVMSVFICRSGRAGGRMCVMRNSSSVSFLDRGVRAGKKSV